MSFPVTINLARHTDTTSTVRVVPQPVPPSAAKSAQMSRVRNVHTAPEMAIRRELHRRGLRYRVNMPLPRIGRIRPDIVFTRVRVAVFVDGCFWHRCPEHGSSPKNQPGLVAPKTRHQRRTRPYNRHIAYRGRLDGSTHLGTRRRHYRSRPCRGNRTQPYSLAWEGTSDSG